MKKTILFLTMLLMLGGITDRASAQMKDPTTWTYEVKKTGANQYDLIFHLSLEDKWHVWALKPGGDGSLIPVSFNFAKNPNVKLVGTVKESDKGITENIEALGGPATYHKGKVDFIQTVTVKGKVKITGKHEYQACNDNLCLAAKTKNFEFDIK